MVISPLVKIQTWLAYMYNPSVYHTRKRGGRWGAKSGQRGGGNGVSWLLNGVLVGVGWGSLHNPWDRRAVLCYTPDRHTSSGSSQKETLQVVTKNR